MNRTFYIHTDFLSVMIQNGFEWASTLYSNAEWDTTRCPLQTSEYQAQGWRVVTLEEARETAEAIYDDAGYAFDPEVFEHT